jgi:hypothetical protein
MAKNDDEKRAIESNGVESSRTEQSRAEKKRVPRRLGGLLKYLTYIPSVSQRICKVSGKRAKSMRRILQG